MCIRDRYGAEIENYFDGLEKDVESACYASYFTEFADYYGREGIRGTEMLKLLYQSFRALLKQSLPNRLVQRIFELKIMVINGEYTEQPQTEVSDSARYAWEYVDVYKRQAQYDEDGPPQGGKAWTVHQFRVLPH